MTELAPDPLELPPPEPLCVTRLLSCRPEVKVPLPSLVTGPIPVPIEGIVDYANLHLG